MGIWLLEQGLMELPQKEMLVCEAKVGVAARSTREESSLSEYSCEPKPVSVRPPEAVSRLALP